MNDALATVQIESSGTGLPDAAQRDSDLADAFNTA